MVDLPQAAGGHAANEKPHPPSPGANKPVKKRHFPKYKHAMAVHSKSQASLLSHDRELTPSFLGFRNLMTIVLVAGNARLVLENYLKYGVLVRLQHHGYRTQDVVLGLASYALIPCFLFIAFSIEWFAAKSAKTALGRAKTDENTLSFDQNVVQARHRLKTYWKRIAFAHVVNSTFCLFITSLVVYCCIHHPLIGTFTEAHVIIVWLKNVSYALTNRDLRHAYLNPAAASEIPNLYLSVPYPQNITLSNLCYFWWAPTLVYQPVYPRTNVRRPLFILKRLGEIIGLITFMWICSAQYAAPILYNSLDSMQALDLPVIMDRIMKLSTVSLVVWLAGFFALFQSFMNALAETIYFGDRVFYEDWWNSGSVRAYWSSWNLPVYQFMKRHVFAPSVTRGYSNIVAGTFVFVFSGILHELVVGVPTHNILGVAFVGMVVQLPLIQLTRPLEKMEGVGWKIVGNSIFWISFCLVGQPLGALSYFFAWQAKYGSTSEGMKPLKSG